jgi:SAM-dependent methyltransferase
VQVDPSNAEMARAWNGDEGSFWAEHADDYDESIAAHAQRFRARAAIAPGEQVLDVGCGNGAETVAAAAASGRDGHALGLDLSAPMLARARERADRLGIANATFVQGDAQCHPLGAEAFDVAISRFGAMFFGDPLAAFRNIARALRPGGRLVLLTWRSFGENEWQRVIRDALAAGRTLPEPPTGAPGPFALADPGRVQALLDAAGLTDTALEPVDEDMHFGADAERAFSFVSGQAGPRALVHDLDDAAAARARRRLRDVLAAAAGPDGVRLPSAAWVVTARRP